MTDIGHRMKTYEKSQQQHFLPGLPVIVRIDGKNFHRWTIGLEKPFDKRLMEAFDQTAMALVKESGARLAYTQSDEITLLLWRGEDYRSQIYFEGKPHKLVSVLASFCTALFNLNAAVHLGSCYLDRQPALFDARAFAVPSLEEAMNVFWWREQDARKNSVAALAQSYFSHRDLQGKSGGEMKAMLEKHGEPWDALSTREREGQYVGRKSVLRELDEETFKKMPDDNRPKGPVERRVVELVSPGDRFACFEEFLWLINR